MSLVSLCTATALAVAPIDPPVDGSTVVQMMLVASVASGILLFAFALWEDPDFA